MRHVYREGLNLNLPWNSVTQYSTRVNVETLELTLLTADLLETQVTVAFQYEINRLTVPLLHKYAGTDFLKKIIVPQVISAVREMVAKHSSKEAFTDEIQRVIKRIAIVADDSIIDQLSPPGRTNVKLVNISAVQLISVSYPEEVREAIRQKMVAAQNADGLPQAHQGRPGHEVRHGTLGRHAGSHCCPVHVSCIRYMCRSNIT